MVCDLHTRGMVVRPSLEKETRMSFRRVLAVVVLAVPQLVFAQANPVLEPNELLNLALESMAELVTATKTTGDASAKAAATKANAALTRAVEAMRLQPLCRQQSIIDATTFGFLVEELQRGNRTGTLSLPFITQTLQSHVLSVSQLKALLELVPRSSDRLVLVKLASRRLVDPGLASELYSLFPLRPDQRALALILAGP